HACCDRGHHVVPDRSEVLLTQRLLRTELIHVHRAPPVFLGARASCPLFRAASAAGATPAFPGLRRASIHARSFARALLTCTRTVAGEIPRIAATSSVGSSWTSRRITASRSFAGSAS